MTASDQTDITLLEDNGVAWLTLNRPDKLNSFTANMHQQLRDALRSVQTSDTIRCLVITGAGRGFSAGQDLADIAESDLDQILERDYNPLVTTLKGLDMPVIACVNGVAAGAGANIALACDIVLAAQSASFIQSFSQIGLVPDAGGSWSLPRLIGLPRAMALAMTGERVSSEQAQSWGMIWRSVEDDKLIAETQALAHKLANMPTIGLAFTKKLLNESWTRSLDEQLLLEKDFQMAASKTADYAEGVDAFLNKRKPDFKGR